MSSFNGSSATPASFFATTAGDFDGAVFAQGEGAEDDAEGSVDATVTAVRAGATDEDGGGGAEGGATTSGVGGDAGSCRSCCVAT